VARTPFKVEVLTPEGPVFDGEVEMLSTRTEVGSIGILANHTPLLGMLAPTELKLHVSESETVRYAQGEGYIQVADNHALVLVEEAITPEELDVAKLNSELEEADAAVEAAEPHSEALRRSLRDRRRAQAFLEVAGAEAS